MRLVLGGSITGRTGDIEREVRRILFFPFRTAFRSCRVPRTRPFLASFLRAKRSFAAFRTVCAAISEAWCASTAAASSAARSRGEVDFAGALPATFQYLPLHYDSGS